MAQTYTYQIENGCDWREIVRDAKRHLDEDGIGWCFLGTVLELAPSGKYWTGFASRNVRAREAKRDVSYFNALDKVAAKHGGMIERGNDPLDVFFCVYTQEN